jgi:TRAP-type mannitol/chloroaromatic compound transport system permease small subunit
VLFFLLPACGLIMWHAWPMFWESFVTNEQSSNSGGLVRWPVKLLIPVGFTLLIAAAVSHLIKCIAFLRGQGPDPTRRAPGKTPEEEVAEEIARRAHADAAAAAAGGKATD